MRKNAQNPLISVIVPVYNTKAFLERCIDSLVNQTLQEIEIICIDDESTDGSLEILQRYAEKNPRIVVIHQENAGQSVARNQGVKIARGEYIMFVDSDDWISADACFLLWQEIQRGPVDVLLFKQCSYKNNKTITSTLLDPYISKFKWKTVCPRNNPELLNSHVGPVGKIFRTEYLRKNSIFFEPKFRASEDLCFYICVLLSADSLRIYNSEALYCYNLNNSQSCIHRKKNFVIDYHNQIVYCKWKIENSLISNECKRKFLYHLYNRCIRCMCWNLDETSFKKDQKEELASFTECLDGIKKLADSTVFSIPAYFDAIEKIYAHKHPCKRRLFHIEHRMNFIRIRFLGLKLKFRKRHKI